MPLDLKAALKALLGQGATEEEIRSELAQGLQNDLLIDRLVGDGLLPADDQTRAAAMRLAQADSAALDALLRAPRPKDSASMAASAMAVPTGDQAGAAIKAHMDAGLSYHEAALKVEKGA